MRRKFETFQTTTSLKSSLSEEEEEEEEEVMIIKKCVKSKKQGIWQWKEEDLKEES